MKQTIELEKIGLVCLTDIETIDIDGDGFWYDAAYVLGGIVRGLKEFSSGAASFAKTNPIYYK